MSDFQINVDSTPIDITEKEKLLESIYETRVFLDELSYNMM